MGARSNQCRSRPVEQRCIRSSGWPRLGRRPIPSLCRLPRNWCRSDPSRELEGRGARRATYGRASGRFRSAGGGRVGHTRGHHARERRLIANGFADWCRGERVEARTGLRTSAGSTGSINRWHLGRTAGKAFCRSAFATGEGKRFLGRSCGAARPGVNKRDCSASRNAGWGRRAHPVLVSCRSRPPGWQSAAAVGQHRDRRARHPADYREDGERRVWRRHIQARYATLFGGQCDSRDPTIERCASFGRRARLLGTGDGEWCRAWGVSAKSFAAGCRSNFACWQVGALAEMHRRGFRAS